jgi:hypothetical protein
MTKNASHSRVILLSNEDKELSRQTIEEATFIFGSNLVLAKALGLLAKSPARWLTGENIISGSNAILLELIVKDRIQKINNLEITKEKLRPDIFN